MKETKLIFHIGMPKCASISIQKFLCSNEFIRLANENYRYVVITRLGRIIDGENIVLPASRSPHQYLISASGLTLHEILDKIDYTKLVSITEKYKTLIFSSEEWGYRIKFFFLFLKNL